MGKASLSRRKFLAASALGAASVALDWKRIEAWAANMSPKTDYPTVVIGAGLGGLSCGAHLAKQGIPVTVVEQNSIAGGYALSFERAGGKFVFDVSLHGVSAKNNAAARILDDLGLSKELHLVRLSEVCHLKTPGLDIVVPEEDPEAYILTLTQHFPSEEEGIRRFIHEVLSINEEADQLHRKGKFTKVLFPFQYPRMWKILDKTLAEMLNDYVKDPSLRNIFASLWDFHGLPPSKVSALYFAAAMGDSLKNGTYYIKKRCRDLPYALIDLIGQSGGQVLYNTSVEGMRVTNGAVDGVELSGGKILPARAVVSNASALETFRSLVPQGSFPEGYLKDLEAHRPSLSSFIVWLGLNRNVRGRINACGVQVLSGRGAEADYQACVKGAVEDVPFRVGIYDNMYEGYSGPNTSTMRLFCLSGYEPWRKFEADYRAGRKEDYNREKSRWAECLIRRAEEVVPGLSSMIEIEEAATPLTNWRYTRNPEGAIYGFEQSVDNASIKRLGNRTPVKGLYLAGAWCNPGGGFSGALVSGQMAFREILKDWGA